MSYLVKCDSCGSMRPEQEMYETDDGTLCPNCVIRCDNCGEALCHSDDMFVAVRDEVQWTVCYDCLVNGDWDEDKETEE